MSRWLAEIRRRPVRSLGPVALLALAPKCALCVLAYAGLGAALGLGPTELCGASTGSPGGWAPSLALSGLALGISRWRARESPGTQERAVAGRAGQIRTAYFLSVLSGPPVQ